MTPPFLLLMPSYNQARYIVEAVRSVLAQDDPNWELWIVDNSTDSTPEAMREFSDPRIRFHHIPERMDPGSCLNWMLEHASGRDFSYVHTDNNLHPSYVRKMRKALASHPMALAYCDMRTIDANGRRLNVFRRGSFDLARLISADSLGVPFAATMDLARSIGGFSTRDVADDVRFCASAYGVAKYEYLPEALLDYRLHGNSRTEGAGGTHQIEQVLIKLMPKIFPLLESRGFSPLQVLSQSMEQAFNEVDLFVEDIWYRDLSRSVSQWWRGEPRTDDFFFMGLLEMEGFSSRFGKPPIGFGKRITSAKVGSLALLKTKWTYYRHRRTLRRHLRRARSMLLSFAHVHFHAHQQEKIRIRVDSLDFRTVWAARQLQLGLNIEPTVGEQIHDLAGWLNWPRATGDEWALDCRNEITLARPRV